MRGLTVKVARGALKVFPAVVGLGVLLSITPQPAASAQRQLLVIEGADYYGRDYETRKGVDLDECKAACLADVQCKAFTYNTSARWCFLKSSYRDLRPFGGAVSGHLTEGAADAAERRAARRAELRFLPRRVLDEAQQLLEQMPPATSAAPGSFDVLMADAAAAEQAGNPRRAAALYASALKLAPESPSLWLRLAQATRGIRSPDWKDQQRLRKEVTAAAIAAYLRSQTAEERAAALGALGQSLADRSDWRTAIRATRASLALNETPSVRAAYAKLIAEHGFRITGHRVDAEAASPRICVEFSDLLPVRRPHLSDFVSVGGGANLAVEVEAKQICVDGVEHGSSYRILVRAGLPAADGEKLAKTADLDVYVRDRPPSARFLGRAYVLPKGGDAAIPLVSVNSTQVDLTVYRVGDRGMAGIVAGGPFLKQLSSYQARQIADQKGEKVWTGSVQVPSKLNREVTTAVPVGSVIKDLKPGAYVMTARAHELAGGEADALATQWFVVSDLGLATLSGSDGLSVLVRSLSTAGPVGGVRLRLIARNDEVLGRAVTDAAGYARLDPGLLRGGGGDAPALVIAEGPAGDYALLDLTKTPFDLADRGVGGRPAPKPLDVYLVSDRGIYRPGETVHLTALLRNAKADAVEGLPLTIMIKRPDGVERQRTLARDEGLGGHQAVLKLLPTAMRGTWHAAVHADPKGPALAEVSFAVEDFEPERLTFDLESPVPAIDPANPPAVALVARFLYGAPAANLGVEGETELKTVDTLPGFPGFRFGLAAEKVEPVRRPLPAAATDAHGEAQVPIELPEMVPASKPREANVTVRVLDTGGRPVERSISLPVSEHQGRIGIRPLFKDAVDEGGNAAFDVIALGSEGQREARAGLSWTLSKLTTSFQWYETDGSWDYEPVVSRQRVASGTLAIGATGLGHLEAPVEWGEYELEVRSSDPTVLPASVQFNAGWYVTPKAVDTPDLLKVSLDRPRYRVGETAQVRIEPRFPGMAVVMVMADRLISMTPASVPAQGATVEVPVTGDWGPGAYVTAILFRPMDLGAKRMPGRAIGLTWAEVDPGDRKLEVRLAAAEKAQPRRPLPVNLDIINLKPGEAAYVTVAAVDVGILNLTRYQAPAPDDWYLGQRRLGMEIRDLYGQLIDRMQGVPGAVRSGGGSGVMGIKGPPPNETLVAFYSGIFKVDGSGKASVSFDLPDFNGTVRVMAMAWSARGVGHAVQEVLVRDPVVVSVALPRFLAPHDKSRILVDLAQVEGPAGEMGLRVAASSGIALDQGAASPRLDLKSGAHAQALIPMEALAVGDHQLTIALTLPDGRVRANQPPMVRSSVEHIRPGDELRLDAGRLDGLVPGTGTLLVSATGAGPLDVPGLVRALDRYPYGCSEQLTSRALPLLYLDKVALAAGLSGDKAVRPRVGKAIERLLAHQSSDGGFGLWGPGDDDLWLDAYVTDFLTRARERGYPVPAVAFQMALDNLRNRVAYAPDFQSGGEDIAYALYVLARNARAVMGDLRYYEETKLKNLATPLAKAQVGAALALYGDAVRGATAFHAALDQLGQVRDPGAWRPDYGSSLRDAAAVLTLAAETGMGPKEGVDTAALARQVQDGWAAAGFTSTQDDAWLLLAAHALMEGAARPRLAVDGKDLSGPLYRSFNDAALGEHPMVVGNRGGRTLDVLVMESGVPLAPPDAGGRGYAIERAYYDLDGKRVDPSRAMQGERMVAILTVRADRKRAARLIVDDPLPAGFEIDNPNLLKAGDISGIPWLDVVQAPAHKEFRTDRFIAAVDRSRDDPRQFQLAYVVRAVSPGRFLHPAATVEDMYRPGQRGWTGQGAVEVLVGGTEDSGQKTEGRR
jgi:uncharacterized protein YfaS (alpha-2-macroglobulin family)